MLEAQRQIEQPDGTIRYVHVGYMNKHFKTKVEAAAYYQKHNPFTVPMTSATKWRSGNDVYGVRMVVREYTNERCDVWDYENAVLDETSAMNFAMYDSGAQR